MADNAEGQATEQSSVTPEAPVEEAQTPEGQAETGQAPEETFIDPKKLPPELQPIYKQMQGAFTQKTQSVAEQRKQFEAEKSELSRRAALYESLSKRPGFDEWLAGGSNGNGRSASATQAAEAPGSKFDPAFRAELDAYLKATIGERVDSITSAIDAERGQVVVNEFYKANPQAKAVIEAGITKNPALGDEMESLLENGVPIERAFKVVFFDRALEQAIEARAVKAREASKAKVETGGSGNGQRVPAKITGRQAVEMALESTGVTFPE